MSERKGILGRIAQAKATPQTFDERVLTIRTEVVRAEKAGELFQPYADNLFVLCNTALEDVLLSDEEKKTKYRPLFTEAMKLAHEGKELEGAELRAGIVNEFESSGRVDAGAWD